MLGQAWGLFWRPELPWLGGFALLFTLMLVRPLRGDRRVLRNTLLFLGWALVFEAAGALFLVADHAQVGGVLRIAGILATGVALIRLAGLALFRAVLPALGVQTPRIAEDILVVVAYAGWGLLQLRSAGMDLSSLVTTSAVITAVIAFSMQDTLGNVLGGLMLELDESLSIGDWVKLDDLSGRVVQIHWRHTSILTRNGEIVVVPNGALMKTRFTVLGNPDRKPVRWRRWVWFNVDYEAVPSRVLALATRAVAGAEIEHVARDPEPSCVLMEFQNGYARYALRYWLTDPLHDDPTDTAVRIHLHAALRREGIEIAMPQNVIHAITDTDEMRARRALENLERRVAALAGVELFAPLDDAERRALAARLKHAPFVKGDVMTRQGAVAHWLYIVVSGEAEVSIEVPGGGTQRIATLGPGMVFGEMGLMTGEPRSATVTALSEVECYRLEKGAFADILHSRPAIAEAISAVLAARAMGLKSAAELAETTSLGRKQGERLLERIRAFFGLAENRT